MGALIFLHAAMVVIATALAWIVVRSARRLPEKLGALSLALALMVVGYIGLLGLLGRPKPIELEWGLSICPIEPPHDPLNLVVTTITTVPLYHRVSNSGAHA